MSLHKKDVYFIDTLAIIKRIELRLAELGMSKAEFYSKSGISSASYSQWNTGKYKPSDAKLNSAALALDTTVDYLCGKEKAPTNIGERRINDDDIKFALFGGDGEITDAMYEEVRRFAAYIKQREADKKE